MNPKFDRTRIMIGEEGIDRLQRSHVTVIGLGAVGSHVIEALARVGVGSLRLVDFDSIKDVNFNRQLLALESTRHLSKAEAAREHLLDINPELKLEVIGKFFDSDTADEILGEHTDFIADAIDTLGAKATLIMEARRREIPIISSMGAATRTDPTQVRYGDIFKINTCPLAAKLRSILRKQGVSKKVMGVYSIEPPNRNFIGVSREDDIDGVPMAARKKNALGSLPTITGVFGYVLANQIVQGLLGGER